MVGIQFFATPMAKAINNNGIVVTTYHIANLYRGRERYKVWFTCGLDGSRWGVTGHNKPTGFEPFCQKWAERFKKIAGLVSWGYSWNGYTFTDSIEEEMCKYSSRLQIITCYPKQDEMEVLMSFYRDCGVSSYSFDYIRMKTSARQGWTKTINVK